MNNTKNILEHFKENYPNAFCLVNGRIFFTKEEYMQSIKVRKQAEASHA